MRLGLTTQDLGLETPLPSALCDWLAAIDQKYQAAVQKRDAAMWGGTVRSR